MERKQPAVAGHDVVRFLGRGGNGEVWLLRERASGALRAGKLIRVEAGVAGRREARRLRAQVHPHIVACHGMLPVEGRADQAVLLMDYAAGGSLARLVAARGRLTVGETVTTVGPLAQALAALHGNGTVHLDVSPANVLFTAAGKPVLADLGAARTLGEAAGPREGTEGFVDPVGTTDLLGIPSSADVYSLGAIAWFCLTGSIPGAPSERPPLALAVEGIPSSLAAAVAAALADDPRHRPTAAELSRAILRSARPEPVDLAPAVDDDVLPDLVTRLEAGSRRRRRHRLPITIRAPRRASPRTAAMILGLATLIASVTAVGAAIARNADPAASSDDEAAGSWQRLPEALRRRAESSDPVQAVQALAEIRTRALVDADSELLGHINAAGSPAAIADESLVNRLTADGKRLEAFSTSVLGAELVPGLPAEAETAMVQVHVVTSGFSLRRIDGSEFAPPGAGSEQTLRIVLTRSDTGWRVERVLAA
jgi:hypothetical protein